MNSLQNGQILNFNALINTLNYPSINLPTELNFNEVTPALDRILSFHLPKRDLTVSSRYLSAEISPVCVFTLWTSPVPA
ncbi:hypothetical protein CEXT_372591 [Caerostris extrusa]|uniref:Uncharacterized protein n=1 Tax=Caerostris extrusa TaxID=172846 RepID=A0AAV4TVU2_CAEEX|nr:hypothetical protein CEXT_372591 [Caerostris extrusa]